MWPAGPKLRSAPYREELGGLPVRLGPGAEARVAGFKDSLWCEASSGLWPVTPPAWAPVCSSVRWGNNHRGSWSNFPQASAQPGRLERLPAHSVCPSRFLCGLVPQLGCEAAGAGMSVCSVPGCVRLSPGLRATPPQRRAGPAPRSREDPDPAGLRENKVRSCSKSLRQCWHSEHPRPPQRECVGGGHRACPQGPRVL